MGIAIAELLKLSLSIYFSIAKMNNITEAELDAFYQGEKDRFINNNPNDLEEI